jgi:hypothetical protein
MSHSPSGAASIIGNVTSIGGAPIVGAAISITADSPRHIDLAASTNQSGQYALNDLGQGIYVILANCIGYQQQRKTTSVAPDQVTVLDFILVPA